MARWTDRFVGDRMAVDRAFGERVAASEFSSQEWGTIMTAVELDIENPESPEAARVIADTSSVDQVMPALEEMRQNLGAVAGGAAGSRGGGRGPGGGSDGGGIVASLLSALGLGGDERAERAEAAAALAEEYARQFQQHLEREGKWERACEAATRADGSRVGDEADSARTGDGRDVAAADDASDHDSAPENGSGER